MNGGDLMRLIATNPTATREECLMALTAEERQTFLAATSILAKFCENVPNTDLKRVTELAIVVSAGIIRLAAGGYPDDLRLDAVKHMIAEIIEDFEKEGESEE